MRLFVAVDPPDETRHAIGREAEGWRARFGRARWVEEQNLHFTLMFLGEQSRAMSREIREALEPATRSVPRFTLTIGGGGAFPERRGARILWLGTDSEGLASLHGAVDQALSSLDEGLRDSKPFRSHLTVARCRPPWSRAEATRWIGGVPARIGRPFEVREAVLYESHLGSRGARYEAVARLPLSER